MSSTKAGSTKLSKPHDPEKVRQVFKWILAGASELDIADAIQKTWPGEQQRPLIVSAIAQFQQSAEFDQSTVRGWCFEAYRDLYRRMVETGDHAGAMRAVQLIQKMTQSV